MNHKLDRKTSGNLSNTFSLEVVHEGLNISVDPRLILMSVVQYLSDDYTKTWRGAISSQRTPYSENIQDYFKEFKNHKVVEMLTNLSVKPFDSSCPPFSYGAPANVMLYLLEDFTLHEDIYQNSFLVNRAGGGVILLEFIEALKDFYNLSNFNDFYTSNKSYYQALIKDVLTIISNANYVNKLETFHGLKQNSYNITIVPTYSGCYGPCLEDINGRKHLYSIICPTINISSASSQDFFDKLCLHEFSHSFINPITDKNIDVVNQFKRDDIIKEVSEKSSYIDWYDIVNEYIIRSITTYFAYKEDEEKGAILMQQEKNEGFYKVDKLLLKLKDYETQRNKYATIEDFYFELLSVFKL